MAELSPMMKQYFEIKKANPDCILFYRLGDFYEMFYEDAKLASKELELTLTGRDCGQAERAPMCGVPFHSCEGYIAQGKEKHEDRGQPHRLLRLGRVPGEGAGAHSVQTERGGVNADQL